MIAADRAWAANGGSSQCVDCDLPTQDLSVFSVASSISLPLERIALDKIGCPFFLHCSQAFFKFFTEEALSLVVFLGGQCGFHVDSGLSHGFFKLAQGEPGQNPEKTEKVADPKVDAKNEDEDIKDVSESDPEAVSHYLIERSLFVKIPHILKLNFDDMIHFL